jgi:hypothetical protein
MKINKFITTDIGFVRKLCGGNFFHVVLLREKERHYFNSKTATWPRRTNSIVSVADQEFFHVENVMYSAYPREKTVNYDNAIYNYRLL